MQKDENEYIFSVSDNDIEIEKQYMERIFVIFKRLHTQDGYKRTKIELSIVKRIIGRYNRRIWVESEPCWINILFYNPPIKKAIINYLNYYFKL